MVTLRRPMPSGLLLLLMILAAAGCSLFSGRCTADPQALSTGEDCVLLPLRGWPGAEPVRVHTYLPKTHTPQSPVLLVMHGALRTARNYRASWENLAETYHLLIVAPELPTVPFGGARGFQQGNLLSEEGRLTPPEQWSFQVIEEAFDLARTLAGNTTQQYYLFGHSAGAQFVHRLVWMTAERARLAGAVAANAGWYTLPDVARPYPHGLHGTPGAGPAGLRAALAAPLTVLLGEEDTSTWGLFLRSGHEAERQGPHRLARGRAFFAQARSIARERGLPFKWRLQVVPGVGHDQERMAPAAARLLFGDAHPGGTIR